jgi:transposase
MIDTSIVRVHQHGACISDNNHQAMGRSRGGLTSKIHAVVDTNGLPVHLALTPGEAHDNRQCSVLLSALLPQTMLLADRGYDADWIRELARQQGAWANIPPKRNRKDPICFSPYLYRARNLIERFFNKIKQCRRVATRYDKLAANYLAFARCDRRNEPHDEEVNFASTSRGNTYRFAGIPLCNEACWNPRCVGVLVAALGVSCAELKRFLKPVKSCWIRLVEIG